MDKENNNLNRSVRDIEISERRKKFDNRSESSSDKTGISYKAKNKKKWPKLLGGIIILFLVFLFINFFFHSAKIIVTPKKEILTFSNDVYKAVVSPEKIYLKENDKIITKISKGKIKIINDTEKTQKLKKETRFKINDSDIIYKIYDSVTIPPNDFVVAEAFSVETGEKYNKKRGTKLVVPGFAEAKMDQEYKNITGVIEKTFTFSDEDIMENKPAEESKLKSEVENNNFSGSVLYKIFEISSEDSKKISSLGAEEVQEKAKGKIKITNNTNKTQKLRKETRFQNGNLIFKTYKSVTIPSKSFVIAEAFADISGEESNIKKGTEFKIPGFAEAKMDDEYEKINGLAYQDFKKGFNGKILVPNKDELEKAKKELEKRIKINLENKLSRNVKKEDYIFISDLSSITLNYETESEEDKIIVKVKAIQKTPIILKKDFITMILKFEEITKEDIDNLAMKNFSKMIFKVLNTKDFNIDSGDNFFFSVNGEGEIYWVLDQNTFLESIKGNTFDEVSKKLLNSYKNFEFDIKTSPFWNYSIPKNNEDIKIIIK